VRRIKRERSQKGRKGAVESFQIDFCEIKQAKEEKERD
jgi:hypothetical protein